MNKKANDTNPVTDPQEIVGYDYGSLPPGSIVLPTYSGTRSTWVYDTLTGTITLTALRRTSPMNRRRTSSPSAAPPLQLLLSDSGSEMAVLTTAPTLAITDTNSLGLSTSGSRNVGDWTIALSGAADNNGYTINYYTGTLAIAQKNLSVTGLTGTVSKTYDGTTAAILASSNYVFCLYKCVVAGVDDGGGTSDDVSVSTTSGTLARGTPAPARR